MPIAFACQCGKQFRFKDEHAGRRVACPACKREIHVPVPIDLAPVDAIAPREEERQPHAADPWIPPEWQVSLSLSEREKAKPAVSQAGRPFWRDPVVVIGAAVP